MSEKKSILEQARTIDGLLDRYSLVKGLLDSEKLEAFKKEYLSDKDEEEQHRCLRIIDDSLGIVITDSLLEQFSSEQKMVAFYDQYFAADDENKPQVVNDFLDEDVISTMKQAIQKFFVELVPEP